MMRTIIALFLCLFLSIFSFAQDHSDTTYHHCFFEENSFSIGVGSEYSFGHSIIIPQGRLYYNVNERLCFGPEIAHSFNESNKIREYNFVVHYIFEITKVGVYPVVGFTHLKDNHHKSGNGMLFGGGVHRNWRKINVFGEYTHSTSLEGDNRVAIGVLYMISL